MIDLRLVEPVDEQAEELIINKFRPLLNFICSNQTRAGIIYLLVNSKVTNHTLTVSSLCKKLNSHHSTILYHLERLKEWGVVKPWNFNSKKRTYWSLNLKFPNWVSEIYAHLRSNCFTEKELNQLSE